MIKAVARSWSCLRHISVHPFKAINKVVGKEQEEDGVGEGAKRE